MNYSNYDRIVAETKLHRHGVYAKNVINLESDLLVGGAVSVDFGFRSELAMKHVSKTIELMDAVAKINDPQCELLLIRACAWISKLYLAMRTYPPRVFESAQRSFDMALRSALVRIVTVSGLGFGDWQWRLATLPFAFRGLGIYSAGDVLNYAFLALRFQSAALQSMLLRDVGIVASGSTFDDALCVFNTSIGIDFLSNTNGLVAIPKGGSHFRLASCDICFWSGISAGKEVDIGLGGGCDKALRLTDMLLYSLDGGLDVCVDLIGCAAIGYGFLPFSFSSLGELEADAVTLLKRIQKFSMAQDIRARATIHIFNRISFAIIKGAGAQIVSRLTSNLL
nr:hypothetical protein [Tanacetum cinerariifolium]